MTAKHPTRIGAGQTAGARLRSRVEAALAYTEEARGIPLELDELDEERLVRAVADADDAERLRGLWLDEVVGERRHTVLASLRAEARQLDTRALKLMAEIIDGLHPAPKRQQSEAARARWGARRGPEVVS